MRSIPILKFFSEEFVDVRSAAVDNDTRSLDALLEEIADEQQIRDEARFELEIRALRKWDVL